MIVHLRVVLVSVCPREFVLSSVFPSSFVLVSVCPLESGPRECLSSRVCPLVSVVLASVGVVGEPPVFRWTSDSGGFHL